MLDGCALELDADGAEHCAAAVPDADLYALRTFADATLKRWSGVRVFGGSVLSEVLGPGGSVGRRAHAIMGATAQPVRAVLFDKTAVNNWAVAWHQTRTIAVRQRREAPGFGPWSVKAGVAHVEPPFEILAGMITLRVHLDDCAADNAPLLVAPGSHRLGRVPTSDAAAAAGRHGTAVCLAAAGDIWLYRTAIVHASERARQPDRRRVLQIDYADRDLPCGLEWIGIEPAAAMQEVR